MPTPVEILAKVWLATWPVWGGPMPAPVPTSKALAAVAPSRHDAPSSLLSLTDEELQQRIEEDPSSLGSLSIGNPGSARLFNAVHLPENMLWEVAHGAITWGTSETIDALQVVADTVHELFPDAPPITLGDISDVDGGRLKRHESHQGGRDVDVGFYYEAGRGGWFTPGTTSNLDLDRTWALLRAVIVRTDVEKVFLDTKIQKILYKHALQIGEEKEWLDRVFQFSRHSAESIVRHVVGHRTHFHVRFYNPVAQELGRRVYPLLVQMKLMQPPTAVQRVVVRRGQTIGQLAERYGTSVQTIMQVNHLRAAKLRAGRSYRVPVRAAVTTGEPFVLPRRILPASTPATMSSVEWPSTETLYGAEGQ